MNALLVCPEFPATFWSGKYLLTFVGKKAAFPPLGLLTVAALMPNSWYKKLVDINIKKLSDRDIKWADYVFVGAMSTQKKSALEIISRCKKFGVPVVLGGPILHNGCEEFIDVSHFLEKEVENTFQEFAEDLEAKKARRIYAPKPDDFPNLLKSPMPLWELVDDINKYACILVQYGRGCPFGCHFCNIGEINGHKPRTKATDQFIAEIEAIYQKGYRGAIMFADDNLIGNKGSAEKTLNRLAEWQKAHGYPYEFTVEADISLADCESLMTAMVLAGIKKVFLGIESFNKEVLIEFGKMQNARHDLIACVKKMQRYGLVPMSGFIVGADADDPATFDKMMIESIQEAGIATAMVGVLQAPPGTPLYKRLQKEGRLRSHASGNNLDCYPNFIPKMKEDTLVLGFKNIVSTIYSPGKYYKRTLVFLKEYNPSKQPHMKLRKQDIRAFLMSLLYIGILGDFKTSYYFWAILFRSLLKHPKSFSTVVGSQIYRWYFQQIAEGVQKQKS